MTDDELTYWFIIVTNMLNVTLRIIISGRRNKEGKAKKGNDHTDSRKNIRGRTDKSDS